MPLSRPLPPEKPSQLCTRCALCCDGTLFDGVRLEPADRPAVLRAAGLRLLRSGDGLRFPQPCAVLDGERCGAYASRPCYCRRFECGVLRAVIEGRMSYGQALRRVRRARRVAGRIRQLLETLGNRSAERGLRARMVAVSRRLARKAIPPAEAALFGELSLANHQLNGILEYWFYPGTKAGRTGRRGGNGVKE